MERKGTQTEAGLCRDLGDLDNQGDSPLKQRSDVHTPPAKRRRTRSPYNLRKTSQSFSEDKVIPAQAERRWTSEIQPKTRKVARKRRLSSKRKKRSEEQDLEKSKAVEEAGRLNLAGEESVAVLSKGGHPSGITELERRSEQYRAATNLISGVDFDSCSKGRRRTLLTLNQIPGYVVPRQQWADSARLDNQGDIDHHSVKYARLAVQIGNKTHAQANIEIDVKFGARTIKSALVESLRTAEVQWLHRPAKGAPVLESQSIIDQAFQKTPNAKGFAVIITNDYRGKPQGLSELKSIHKDGVAMRDAFKKLNIATHWEQNADKTKLEDIVKQTVAYFESNPPPNPEHFKCIAFVFSGHGAKGDALSMQDGLKVSLGNAILKPIVKVRNTALIHKLFFIDACRGNDALQPIYVAQGGTSKGGPASSIVTSAEGNYMLAYATIPKYQSFMSAEVEGSTWLQALAKRLPDEDSLQNILANVTKELWKKYQKKEWINRWQHPINHDSLLGALYLCDSLDPDVETDKAQPSQRGKETPLATSISEDEMKCICDANDFPPDLNVPRTVWIFGSRFSSLIADGVEAEKFSYEKVVRSAFNYIKRFAKWPDPTVEGLCNLMKQSETGSLQDDRSHSTTLLNSVVGVISAEFDKNPALFSNWLSSLYGKLRLSEDGKRLLSLFCQLIKKHARVATTSFDSLLAQGTSLQSISYSEESRVDHFLRCEEDTVLQLHGSWKIPKYVVFSKSDHDKLALDRGYCDQVASLFRANRVVLIGFDWPPLKRDPHLDLLVKTGLCGKGEGYSANHYILVSRELCTAYSDIKGVVPWPYTGNLLSYLEQWWTMLCHPVDEVQLDKEKRPAFEADSEDDHFSSTMPTKTKMCSPGSLSLENITEGGVTDVGRTHSISTAEITNEVSQGSHTATGSAYTTDTTRPELSTESIEQDYRTILRRNQPKLVQLINLSELIPYLIRQGLLTSEQIEDLLDTPVTHHDRLLKLLNIIEYKGHRGYEKFLQALKEETSHMGHEEVIRILKAEH